MITNCTKEEHILELQKKKRIISDQLIENSDNSNVINNLTEKDIKELLSLND